MNAGASALALLAAIAAAGAQSSREVRLDAGTAQVQQTGRTARDAAGVFGLSWRESSPLFAALLSGAITAAGDSTSAAQATLAAAWRPTSKSSWLTDGGVAGTAFGASRLARGGNFSGFVRERLNFEASGLWAGAALGGTARDDSSSHSTAIDVGAWFRSGEFEGSASLSRIRTGDHPLMEAAGVFLADEAEYDLTDLATELRYTHGPLLLDATATFRNGSRVTTTSQAAFYVSAIWTFSERFSLALATGRLLADPVRGIPDMQITSAAIRIMLLPAHAPRPADSESSTAFAVLTQKSSGALLLVRVIADDSSRVEVAGTFSDWVPVQVTRTNGAWEAEIALPPGRHRVAVRVNGGRWQAPRGTARVRDEFGGEAGLIVVP